LQQQQQRVRDRKHVRTSRKRVEWERAERERIEWERTDHERECSKNRDRERSKEQNGRQTCNDVDGIYSC
jgi:hypothetical protein